MSLFRQPSIVTLTATILFSFVSHTTNNAPANAAMTSRASAVDAIALRADSVTHSFNATVTTTLLAQKVGNLLSLEQTAQLTRLPIPIVAPMELPIGFRLVRAEGEAGSYVNGDDDSGYAIDYQGENNTCLSIRSSKDGPRGLEKIRQVQTRFGSVTVYAETFDGHRSLVSFLGIKGNPMLISGGMLPDSTANGVWRRCRAVSVETYTQVLKSLTLMKGASR